MNTDVRIGDVWRSATGRNIVRVERIEPYMPGSEWSEAYWRRLTKDYAPAGQAGKCMLHNFVRGRTLVERGGVRVGDVWRGDIDDYRVASLYGDTVQGTCGEGTFTFNAALFAGMTLVERDGKAV